MYNLMDEAEFDWSNIEPLLDAVEQLDGDLATELRSEIETSSDVVESIAKRALIEAEDCMSEREADKRALIEAEDCMSEREAYKRALIEAQYP